MSKLSPRVQMLLAAALVVLAAAFNGDLPWGP